MIILGYPDLKKRVIPQSFLFGLRQQGERKFMRDPRSCRYPCFRIAARLWIPHKFPFVRYASEKEILRNDAFVLLRLAVS